MRSEHDAPPVGGPWLGYRMAHAPLPYAVRETVGEHRGPLDLLGVRGPSHVIVLTADGPRGYGALSSHSDTALEALDAALDYRDAANEDADGRLPHERASRGGARTSADPGRARHRPAHQTAGAAPPQGGGMSHRVPNAPLRDAFRASGAHAVDVCWTIGMTRANPRGRGTVADVNGLKRALGITAAIRRGERVRLQTIDAATAAAVCIAIDVDVDDLYPQTADWLCECGEELVVEPIDGLCGWCREERAATEQVAA